MFYWQYVRAKNLSHFLISPKQSLELSKVIVNPIARLRPTGDYQPLLEITPKETLKNTKRTIKTLQFSTQLNLRLLIKIRFACTFTKLSNPAKQPITPIMVNKDPIPAWLYPINRHSFPLDNSGNPYGLACSGTDCTAGSTYRPVPGRVPAFPNHPSN